MQVCKLPPILQRTYKFLYWSKSNSTFNNNSIEITIKNQPFDYSNNGITYQIYFECYCCRDMHFSNTDNWTEVYPLENLTSSKASGNGIPMHGICFLIAPTYQIRTILQLHSLLFQLRFMGLSGYDVLRADTGHNAWLPDIS